MPDEVLDSTGVVDRLCLQRFYIISNVSLRFHYRVPRGNHLKKGVDYAPDVFMDHWDFSVLHWPKLHYSAVVDLLLIICPTATATYLVGETVSHCNSQKNSHSQ